MEARSCVAFLAVAPEILFWSRAASTFDFFFGYSLVFCGGVQEFASVFECAVDEAGAAVDATFGEEVAALCGIHFSSGNQGEGSLLSLSAIASILSCARKKKGSSRMEKGGSWCWGSDRLGM